MSSRPALHKHYWVENVAGEGVYLLHERGHVHLSAPVFSSLVPLLDGQHSVERIFAMLRDQHSAHEVYGALTQLRRRGVLMECSSDECGAEDDRAQSAFWDAHGVGLGEARRRLAATSVEVDVAPGLDAQPWHEALTRAGLSCGVGKGFGPSSEAEFRVVLVHDYLDPRLGMLDQQCRVRGQSWLLARPRGESLWLGPLFVPGQTGCWHCLAQRLRGHRRLEAHLARATGRAEPWPLAVAASPSTTQAAAGLLAAEAARYATTGDCSLRGRVRTLHWPSQRWDDHVLVRRPQCAACGHPPALDRTVSVTLDGGTGRRADGSVGVVNDAGLRGVSPADTVARLRHHVSPITGVIGSLDARLPDDAAITPLFVTDHSFVDMGRELYFLREGFRKRSGGKGTARDQAMASAIGESIERYCGVFTGDEPRTRTSAHTLRDSALWPNAVMGYSEAQLAGRAEQNAYDSRVRWVPEPFDPDAEVDWTPLVQLDPDGRPGGVRYLPTACCYYGVPPAGPCFAVADSNGCAAGNTVAEAVLQGLLELVERDCVAIWWYGRHRRPGIDLDGAGHSYATRLLRHYHGLGRELWALDLTHDLGIPTVAALSRRIEGPHEDIILGFGCHPHPDVALVRALTELNQSLPSVPTQPTADPAAYGGSNREAVRWWTEATVAGHPYLTSPVEPGPMPVAPEPSPDGHDAASWARRCVRTLSHHGLSTFVLDQSRPDIELSVVRVVVPGLRHFWPRFGPGRLYDVPVRLGWRERPHTEAELNPYVVYF